MREVDRTLTKYGNRGRLTVLISLLAMSLLAAGCGSYLQNRYHDFRDVVTVGAGVTAAEEGPIAPGFGLYGEATEFLHLGFMCFDGYMAEWDRRAMCVKKTSERKIGFGPFHRWYVDESYYCAGPFKTDAMAGWQKRMDEKTYDGWVGLAGLDKTARETSAVAKRMQFHDVKLFAFPRGWQDWGYVGLDAAFSEPFLLHLGVKLRLGIDMSQVTDFVLGFFTIDYYGDDASEAEIKGTAKA